MEVGILQNDTKRRHAKDSSIIVKNSPSQKTEGGDSYHSVEEGIIYDNGLRKLKLPEKNAVTASSASDLENQIMEVSKKRSREAVTPKYFFKSFSDFSEFDLTLKHQLPIQADEFRFLVEKEAEPDNIGWEVKTRVYTFGES